MHIQPSAGKRNIQDTLALITKNQIQVISKILNTLKQEGNYKLNNGATECEIIDFEIKTNGKLPELLRNLYLETNGGYDGGLLTFYSLDKITNIHNFDFGYYDKSGLQWLAVCDNRICYLKCALYFVEYILGTHFAEYLYRISPLYINLLQDIVYIL